MLLRVGVIGGGSAGTRHALHLLAHGCEVAVFDPAAPELPDGASRAGGLDELVTGTDAIVVASPSALHAEHARGALAAGRHVLVEKPLATSASEAARLADLADEGGTTAAVAMNLRFHPGVVALRDLIAAGTLGRVLFARASFGYDLRLWRPGADYRQSYSARLESGGGILFDAIHEFDYMLWLLGPAAAVAGTAGRLSDLEVEAEDCAVGVVTFGSGCVAAIDVNFFEPAYRRGCLLVGSDATVEWEWASDTIRLRRGDAGDEHIEAPGEVSATYAAEIDDFLAAIRDSRPPRTTLREGAEAVRLVEALRESARTGTAQEL